MWPVVLTLVLLCFFSQDWMVRVIGRLRMSGGTTKSITLFVVKALLEITIVYFLLLASLKFVEIYTSGTEWTWTAKQRSTLSYATAAFAISCGVWNIVMINISLDVDWKQIRSLFKGHLDGKIIKQFPQIMAWQDALRRNYQTIDALAGSTNQRADQMKIGGSEDATLVQLFLKKIQWLYGVLRLWLFLVSLVKKSHHLVLPYLLVFHVVTLNLVLGVYIVLSTWILEGKSLLGGLPFLHVPLFALVSACACLLLCALLFLGIHFRFDRGETPFERLGCASLAILILLLYSACPVIVLVVLLAFQQVVANGFMTQFFRPSSACQL